MSTTTMLGDNPPIPRAVITELGDEPWWEPSRAGGALVFADVGWDPTEVWDLAVLRRLTGCHAFTPNEVEAMAYTRTDTAAGALSSLTDLVPLAVVTRGYKGAMAIDQTTGEQASVPALDVSALDPTGAGDVFAAALVFGTLDGWPLAERLRFAALASSLSVQQFGGGLAAPGWGDISDWWTRTTRAATEGNPSAVELTESYGFLTEHLNNHEGRSVRRAYATIAQLSDL